MSIDQLGYVRTNAQKRFHKAMLCSCLPKIYGEKIASEKERLLKLHGLEDILQEVMIITPRRMGKTVAAAMFIAALLLCGPPNCEIVVFSVAMRLSRKMIGLIDSMILSYPGGKSRLMSPHTQETITVRGQTQGDVRKCLSLPGNSNVSSFFIVFLRDFGLWEGLYKRKEIRDNIYAYIHLLDKNNI